MKDYYALLGVDKNSTIEQIRTAYRKLAKKWHPDLNSDKVRAEAMMKEINEAYEAIKNATPVSTQTSTSTSKPKSPYAKENDIWDIDINNLEKFF